MWRKPKLQCLLTFPGGLDFDGHPSYFYLAIVKKFKIIVQLIIWTSADSKWNWSYPDEHDTEDCKRKLFCHGRYDYLIAIIEDKILF